MNFKVGKLYKYITSKAGYCLVLWNEKGTSTNLEGCLYESLDKSAIILYIGEPIDPFYNNGYILHKFLYKDRVYYGSLGEPYHTFEAL
jgi:hypothetical protein